MSDKITYFGLTDFRNRKTKFGIKNKDRSRHVYVIGKTGMGKSTILENMAAQDIMNGEGMCFLDPHGSAIDVLIDYIPPERVKDVIYFAPFDTDYPMSFNVLEHVSPDKRHLVVAGLMASFKKIWADSFSARMEYILANTLLALLEYPGATLLGVNRMLAEKDYRMDVIKHITDASVKAFWIDEYNKWDPRYAKEAGAAIQNKIGQFTSNPLIRNIIGQEKSAIDFRDAMDNQKIVLVNLSKGLIGESNGNLLGGMLITKLYLSAMSRADVGASNLSSLPDFFFFVDEFQNFANESFADILSEARKYKLNLTVAHQYVEQMEESVASAIFGNVGTMITFRIGATDAEVFEKQFAPTFTAEDIVNLGKFQIYLSLMIDGIGSRPFSAKTLAPLPTQPISMRNEMIMSSRENYAQPRMYVQDKIDKWYEPLKKPEKRSFDKDGKVKPNPSAKSSDKKNDSKTTFRAPRDTAASPLKQALKDLNEKEAEVEMKQIVSPKLDDLLAKMDSKPSTPKAVRANKQQNNTPTSKNIKKENSQNKNTSKRVSGKSPAKVHKSDIASSVKKKVIIDDSKGRGAKSDTASSLQSALEKALSGSAEASKKPQPQNKKEPIIASKKSSEKNIFRAKKPEIKKIDRKEKVLDHQQAQQVGQVGQIKASGQKEVPEDLLRSILG